MVDFKFHPDMILKVEGNVATVERPDEEHLHKSLHGLSRTLLNNMPPRGTTDQEPAHQAGCAGISAGIHSATRPNVCTLDRPLRDRWLMVDLDVGRLLTRWS